MPKYKKETEVLKANRLAKTYIEKGFSTAAVARKRGVTPQAITQQVHSKPVQDSLQKFLSSDKLKARLEKVAVDGLSAKDKKSKDHYARHKYWHDLMVGSGYIKPGDAGQKVQVFIGSQFSSWIKNIEDNQGRSNARLA